MKIGEVEVAKSSLSLGLLQQQKTQPLYWDMGTKSNSRVGDAGFRDEIGTAIRKVVSGINLPSGVIVEMPCKLHDNETTFLFRNRNSEVDTATENLFFSFGSSEDWVLSKCSYGLGILYNDELVVADDRDFHCHSSFCSAGNYTARAITESWQSFMRPAKEKLDQWETEFGSATFDRLGNLQGEAPDWLLARILESSLPESGYHVGDPIGQESGRFNMSLDEVRAFRADGKLSARFDEAGDLKFSSNEVVSLMAANLRAVDAAGVTIP